MKVGGSRSGRGSDSRSGSGGGSWGESECEV